MIIITIANYISGSVPETSNASSQVILTQPKEYEVNIIIHPPMQMRKGGSERPSHVVIAQNWNPNPCNLTPESKLLATTLHMFVSG